jgi:hypothetical protein
VNFAEMKVGPLSETISIRRPKQYIYYILGNK